MPLPLHPSRHQLAQAAREMKEKEAEVEHLDKMIKHFRSVKREFSAMSDRSPEQEETLRKLSRNIDDLVDQVLRLSTST